MRPVCEGPKFALPLKALFDELSFTALMVIKLVRKVHVRSVKSH